MKQQVYLSRKSQGILLARDNILSITESLLEPFISVCALWTVAIVQEGKLSPIYILLSLIIFLLTFPGQSRIALSVSKATENIILNWAILSGLLIVFAYATQYIYLFPTSTIMLWLILTPALQIFSFLILKLIAPLITKLQGPTKRAVIAGLNEHSLELASRLNGSKFKSIKVDGFFDDQSETLDSHNLNDSDYLTQISNASLIGRIEEMAGYIKLNKIDIIYLSLPMSNNPRVLQMLDDLKDTTVSIYFLPDIFMADLIQGRMDQVGGMPVVAMCETPFTGLSGMVKRIADVGFSLGVLTLIFPILIIIAICVKLSSTGPVIFKQRRYGLDGKEILVYKFRSMTVCEDGGKVTQATKNDQRVTKVGAFLRRTSLDELPQFINVLQGRMSVVGPRPHAVSHNEMYRKMIKGYMIRHKVKPGITGWAQVNGLRGETETIDKMKARIDYDLDYLRNWSPKLDMYIVLKTFSVVFKTDKNVY